MKYNFYNLKSSTDLNQNAKGQQERSSQWHHKGKARSANKRLSSRLLCGPKNRYPKMPSIRESRILASGYQNRYSGLDWPAENALSKFRNGRILGALCRLADRWYLAATHLLEIIVCFMRIFLLIYRSNVFLLEFCRKTSDDSCASCSIWNSAIREVSCFYDIEVF